MNDTDCLDCGRQVSDCDSINGYCPDCVDRFARKEKLMDDKFVVGQRVLVSPLQNNRYTNFTGTIVSIPNEYRVDVRNNDGVVESYLIYQIESL